MSLTVSHYCCCLSLSLPFFLSCYMSLTVSFGFWLSLIVCPSAMELLHVFYFLLWLLAVSHCLSHIIKMLYVSYSLPWLLVVSH